MSEFMRFVFVHTQPWGIVSVQRLFDGCEQSAGSVAKFRLLFWLAARGHEVHLVGNVADQTLFGLRGKYLRDDLASSIIQESGRDESLVVFSNTPSLFDWKEINSSRGTECT